MWWVDCVYMLSASCDYVQQKIDNHSPGITAQKAYRKKWLGGGVVPKKPLFSGDVSNHSFKIFTSGVNLPHGGGPTQPVHRASQPSTY